MNAKFQKITALILLSSFLIFRVAAETKWRSISEYYSYLFEVVFVFIVLFLFKEKIRLWKRIDLNDLFFSFLSLASGFLIFKIAKPMGLIIPFDFTSKETLLFLLIVAPILEELIFRMALWECLKSIYNKEWFLIGTTTILFSLGHLTAYWFVPEEFKSFVLYQSFYVVLVAIAFGRQRSRTNSLSIPILMHFTFNLGFYLGSRI